MMNDADAHHTELNLAKSNGGWSITAVGAGPEQYDKTVRYDGRQRMSCPSVIAQKEASSGG